MFIYNPKQNLHALISRWYPFFFFHALLVNIILCPPAFSQSYWQQEGAPPGEGGRPFLQRIGGDTVHRENRERITAYAAPAAMFAYGYAALHVSPFRRIDEQVQQEIVGKHPHAPFHADNYLEWAPAVAVYGLNAAGVKGTHGFIDRSLLYVFSFGLAQAAVQVLKRNTHQQRPDGSDAYAFPSGHTATAFAGAEFLRQEYKSVSPWYGAGGYATATTTGFLRIYNNKHWLSNTIAGAAIGMASTKFIYWLYPRVRKKF